MLDMARYSSPSCVSNSAWYSLTKGCVTCSRAAFHDVFQFIECQVDAVIGQPALREVVGADTLGSVAAADLQLAVFGLFGMLFFLGGGSKRDCSKDMALARFLC